MSGFTKRRKERLIRAQKPDTPIKKFAFCGISSNIVPEKPLVSPLQLIIASVPFNINFKTNS